MDENVTQLERLFKDKLSQQYEEQKKRQEGAYQKMMEGLNDLEIQSALGDNEKVFEELLLIPDVAFIMISPLFIEEFEKELKKEENMVLLIQEMNRKNLKVEDLVVQYKETADSIEEQLKGTLSPIKIDFLKQIFISLSNIISEAEDISRRTIQIPIEFCRDNVVMPMYAKTGDAGMDIYALEDYTINPGESMIIPTGFKVAIPKGYAILIQPRSGLSAKTKLRVANTPGLIDSGYRDEIGVIIENIEPAIADIGYEFDGQGHPIITSILHGSSHTITKGTRFAQMRLVEVPNIAFSKVENVANIGTNRNGGFGSSDEIFKNLELISEITTEGNGENVENKD